jgi:hypothetical protein
MGFDPRDYDCRDDARGASTSSQGARGSSDDHNRDDHRRQPDARSRDHDDGDVRTPGRGPGNDRQGSDEHARDRSQDPRWAEREPPAQERGRGAADAFSRHVYLPRGPDREVVRGRDREYTLRGSESRTLATVGAFRVVSSGDLRDHHDRPTNPRSGDLRHLREPGLIETARVPGYRDDAVVLTKAGRELLERH